MIGPVLVTGEEAVNRPGVIYGLVDPWIPEVVRYVGQTVNPSARLRGHILGERRLDNGGDTRCHRWIDDIRRQGRLPDMILLEHVPCGGVLDERERSWIARLQDAGQADLNTRLVRKMGIPL